MTAEDILSATIIVCGASAWMEKYHDRMPVLFQPGSVPELFETRPGLTGDGWSFEMAEHDGEYPAAMPQAIIATEARASAASPA